MRRNLPMLLYPVRVFSDVHCHRNLAVRDVTSFGLTRTVQRQVEGLLTSMDFNWSGVKILTSPIMVFPNVLRKP